MKRNLLFLAIILLIGFIVNSCDDEEKETPVCNLGAHLGIGETCNGTNCTYKDYRTVDMKNESHNDYFQWPIYRVGTLSNYGANGADITTTVTNILAGYKSNAVKGDSFIVNGLKSGLLEVHVTYSVPADGYTLKNKQLGIKKLTSVDFIETYLYDLGAADLSDIAPIVQLQPDSDIRLAGGKKLKESFYVVAVIKGKFLNAIIINNHGRVNC